MSEAEILAQLTEIFHELFDDDSIKLTPATSAADIADWDSVVHVTLVVAIEARFGIKFQTAEIEGLRNVGEMVALIAHKLGAASARS